MSAIRHSGKMLLRLGTAPAIVAMRLLIQTECRKSGTLMLGWKPVGLGATLIE